MSRRPRPFWKRFVAIRAPRVLSLLQRLHQWWQGATSSFWDRLCALRERGNRWLLRQLRPTPPPSSVRASLAVEQLEPRLVLDALRLLPGFTANTLPGNNDGSTGPVALGFTVDLGGVNYSSVYVNNNGTVTFAGPSGAPTPFPLNTSSQPIIAPFFADVDTRQSNPVTFGNDMVNGHPAFGVDWFNVDYYNATAPNHVSRLDSFQLVLINRSDVQPGAFDIEFDYGGSAGITWETGDASGGSNGLGGMSARAGYASGNNAPGSFVELAGSGVNGAFPNSNQSTGLINNSLNSGGVLGRYVFSMRDTVTAQPHSYNVLHGQTLTVSAPGVLANDSDSLGAPLMATVVSNPAHGTLTLNANGSFSYLPNHSYS